MKEWKKNDFYLNLNSGNHEIKKDFNMSKSEFIQDI